jgi:hypothetical protein
MPLVRLKLRVSPFVTTDFTGKFVEKAQYFRNFLDLQRML